MFKNLMSKVEEAKKITASVGEQISQQVGDQIRNLNESNPEGGGITRRFKNAMGVAPEAKDLSPSKADNLESVPEGDLLGLEVPRRERRWSGDSNMSIESSVSALFQSVPGMVGSTLETLDSDQESVVEDTGSSLMKSASKEQISTVLSKLQGRAANYKDKYRDLVKQYNTLVTENNKCRTVLAQTQDKALTRIEKLRNDKKVLAEKLRETHERINQEESPTKNTKMEELLEKCKTEISKNRTQIQELTEENEKLKVSPISSDSASTEELKNIEKEWKEKLSESESNSAIQLATTKAEMHGALENKDREIESWRAKCRALEIQDGHANERWQKKVDELQVIVKALEAEKTDMVEKLSTAKQQGVQAVREEEQQKRSALAEEFDKKENEWKEEMTKKIQALQKEHEASVQKMENEFNAKSDKSREHTEETEKRDELISQLNENIAELETKLNDKDDEMKNALEYSSQRQREEVAALIGEHEEIITQTKHQIEVERSSAVSKWEHAQSEIDHLRKKVDSLQKELDVQGQEKNEELFKKEKSLTQRVSELQESLSAAQLKATVEKEEILANHNKEKRRLESDLENLQQELEKKTVELQDIDEKVRIQQEETDVRIKELTAMIDEKSEALRNSEAQKDEIQRDLEAAKELSAMHEHLREELEEAKKQRDTVEIKVLELIERAENAEKALEEDKKRLALEKQEMEESFTKSNNVSLEATELISLDEPDKEQSTQDHDMLLQQISELSSANQTLKEEIDYLKEARAVLEKQLTQEEEFVSNLKTEMEATKKSLTEVSDQLKEKASTASSLDQSNELLNSKVKELELIEKELREQLSKSDVSEEIDRLKNEITMLHSQKESLESDILELKENNQQQLSVAKEEFSAKASFAEDKITELQTELESLKSSLTDKEAVEKTLTEDLHKKQQIIDDQKADIQKKESELSTLEEEIKAQISKINEFENKYKQSLEEKDAELSKINNEMLTLREEMNKNITSNEDLESKGSLSTSKIEELENLNERLRLEFITKEKIIADLRKNVDDAREDLAKKQSDHETELLEVKKKLDSELEAKKELMITIEKKVAEIDSLNRMLQEREDSQKKALEEEQKLREQYASALENVKEQLEISTAEVNSLSSLKSEKESLEKEISLLAEEHAKIQAEREEKWKLDLQESEQKWENKLHKTKQNSEKDVTAAKAELMLEIDSLRASTFERDRKLADSSLEVSRLEQQLISLSTVKEELEEKKEKEKKITAKLTDQEHKIIALEADNQLLSGRKSELEEQRESSSAQITEFEAKIKELETKVQELEVINAEGMRKAAAKHDSDSKKVIRELQKEVKQLYMELNEKTEAFDKLRAEKDVTVSDAAALKTVNSQQHSRTSEKDFMYEEELENMRKRLNDSHKEVDLLRERNELLQRNADSNTKSNSPAMISVNGDRRGMGGYEELGFANSAEAEYLKNVLYRYMAERETLGKECVTLARVIGTVAKFDKRQLDVVLTKEESRVATWVEGTVNQVSHVLGGAR